MKWRILVNGNPVEIDADSLGAVTQVGPGVYSVLLNGQSFQIRLIPERYGMSLEVNGRRFAAEVLDPRNASRKSRATLGTGRQNVNALMPGKVVRVLVREGDMVEPGSGLVVVEAMKMQNEMKASRPGRVVEVRVCDGDTVAAGETLVVLE
ncbi:MAG TPA: biotin/lipoyl-containing protein [Bryobacteraceae bacterium]